MNQETKDKIQSEIIKRNITTRCAGTTETPYSRIQRLSGFLMRDCKVKGESSTIRQYYLAYNRKELSHILNGMRINRKDGFFSPLNEGIKINLSHCFAKIEDFKIHKVN